MSVISVERATCLLSDLVAMRTVNPMGRPYTSAEPVERQAVDYIADLFRPYPVEMRRLDPSPIHESLLITVEGRDRRPYTLLEAHVDTVPADDWLEIAFLPRLRDGQLFGLGACDDKGSLAAMILAVQEMLETGSRPPLPVALLAAGDEEYAQTGIRQFASLDYPLARAVIGEPTRLQPILQHKGVIRWDITVHGRSAHSSQPELGRDAIAGAMRVIRWLKEHQQRLRETFANRLMTGPTITVTMIHGGRTRNTVADECTHVGRFPRASGNAACRIARRADFVLGDSRPGTYPQRPASDDAAIGHRGGRPVRRQGARHLPARDPVQQSRIRRGALWNRRTLGGGSSIDDRSGPRPYRECSCRGRAYRDRRSGICRPNLLRAPYERDLTHG